MADNKDTSPSAVVGIGASAGGLEACRQFLSALAPDTGMAYVFIQHLDPTHESAMPELLKKHAPIPVEEAKDLTRLRPNCLFVMPSNVDLSLSDGVLHMATRPPGAARRMAIDHFFRTLADAQGQNAIGIVLSGSGTDGTLGLRMIKERGGITFAQEPAEAKFDGMPRSAIMAGCADFVLPIGQITGELTRLSKHPHVKPAPGTALEETEDLGRIFILLKKSSGVDFSHYKRSTILRRIARRMVVHRMEQLKEYIVFLQKTPQELQDLYQDILIKVTSFFRDPEVFEHLKNVIFPAMLQGRASESPIRIWIPGCATGEEVYSIAISLLEVVDERSSHIPVQIFATDISDLAINLAREGRYLENIVQDVSPERLRRFFVKSEGGYQVSKTLRDLCVFAKQNMTSDPPFSKLDLISCRNVLIYLEPTLQKRVMPLFHYALKPGGVLMLGTSETVGSFNELFALEEKHFKLYTKKAAPVRLHMDFDTAYRGVRTPEFARHAEQTREDNRMLTDARREADRIIFSKYAAAGVVINDAFDIIQFRGNTGDFLEQGPGDPTLSLLKLAREGLGMEVRALVSDARVKRAVTSKDSVLVHRRGEPMWVRVEVHPLHTTASKEAFFLVLFQETPPPDESGAKPQAQTQAAPPQSSPPPQHVADQQIEQLRRELTATKEHLQAIIEEQEATNEELQSANEEILSSNEELQSINEELETAKEELQSTNEELTTVNEELQNRNLELSMANNDLTNLFNSVNIPIVMLGSDLRIRRFTPQAEKLLSLIPGDVGRPIGDIKPRIQLPDLERLVSDVIESITVNELEVQDSRGHWYAMRIRPYRTRDNKIDGAVLALVDINAAKRSKLQLIHLIQQPMLILDGDLNIRVCNDGFVKRFGFPLSATERKPIYALSDRFTALREPLAALLTGSESMCTVKLELSDGKKQSVNVTAEKVTVSPEQVAAGHILMVSFEG